MRVPSARLMFVCGFTIFFVSVGYTIYEHYHPTAPTEVTLCGFLWDVEGKNPQPVKVTMKPDLMLAQPSGGIITLRICDSKTDLGLLDTRDFEPMLRALRQGS